MLQSSKVELEKKKSGFISMRKSYSTTSMVKDRKDKAKEVNIDTFIKLGDLSVEEEWL